MTSNQESRQKETWSWVATFAWLIVVAIAIYLKGQDYAPDARLSLDDWADVASLVSAIVAPIAVLWVVRSFYVQKRELAAAVQAAKEQSEALGRQVRMLETDHQERISPTIFLRYKRTIAEEGPNKYSQTHKVTLLNVGGGAAYESHFHIVGDHNRKHGWLDGSAAIDAIPPGQSRSTSVVSYVSSLEYTSNSALVELSFKNREKVESKAYYRVTLPHYWQKTVSGKELSREDYLQLMKDGGHPIPTSFNFNSIEMDQP
jgi:hypothetical protein